MSFEHIKDHWFAIEDEDGEKHLFILKPPLEIKDPSLYHLEIIPCMHCEYVAKLIIKYNENNLPMIDVRGNKYVQIYKDPTMANIE